MRVSTEHLTYNDSDDQIGLQVSCLLPTLGRILKQLQVALLYQNGFSQFDNPYSKEAFLEICSEYGVDSDPMKYRGQYFASSFQRKHKSYPTPGLSPFYG